MTFDFSYEQDRGYRPTYADIDWHSKWLANNNNDSAVVLSIMQENNEEKSLELTQKNCFVYLNDTDPAFDVIIFNSDDEGVNWWLCRAQYGNDEFTELIDTVGEVSTLHSTRYPEEHCIDFVLSVLNDDLDNFQSLADMPNLE